MLRTRIKELTCIKYKRSMRRIVETDCVLAATKHLSSRVINGIARYFMRFLLQACSQTDTGVSFSTCGRCGPIKYRDPHQRVIFTLFRQIDTSKSQLTSRKKYRALFKFRSIHHDQLLTRQSIESIFINRINVVALSIKIYYRTRMVTSGKKKENREKLYANYSNVKSKQITVQVTKYTTRRRAGRHICLEIRVIETMVWCCGAFCKLKVLRATTLARIWKAIYIFYSGLESACTFWWQPLSGVRAFVCICLSIELLLAWQNAGERKEYKMFARKYS